MKTTCTVLSALGALLVSLCTASLSLAHPLPDQTLKFQQLPMIETPVLGAVYFGHDELSTAYLDPLVVPPTPIYRGDFMADDFADTVDTPVVHVRFWGSYMNAPTAAPPRVKEFLISFEEDVPVGPNNPLPFSHPGKPIQSEVVRLLPPAIPQAPMSGTFTESLVRGPDPLLGEALFEYNAELACPFPQLKDTVYWLKIVALVDQERDGPIQWGWHNRDYTKMDPFASTPPGVVPGEHKDLPPLPDGTDIWHFQDDAVSGKIFLNVFGPKQVQLQQSQYAPERYLPPFDGPTLIFDRSKDLAFELYTRVPEPSTWALASLALVGLLVHRVRGGRRG